MLPSPSRLRPLDPGFAAERGNHLRLVPRENRVAVLLNANAKRVNAKVRDRLGQVVASEDLFFSSTLDEGAAHARSILERRYGTVMVGGGDGTLSSAMNLLLRAAKDMSRGHGRHALPDIGILRLGTGNGLACMTGAGRPIDDLMSVLSGESSETHTLQLIEDVESGWVFPFASAGYDAQLLNDYIEMVEEARTQVSRTMAKSLAGYFYALGTRTIPTEMKGRRARVRVVATGRCSIVDPETSEEIPLEAGTTLFEGDARAVLVGTSPFYGYGLKVLPYARKRTDRFHVRVSNASIGYLLSRLPSLWNGSLKSSELVDFLCEGIRVESTEPMPMQMAGDARGYRDRFEFRLSERCFRLVRGTA